MELLNDKVSGSALTADEWNQVASELQNIITQTGQSLTNADLNQVGKGIAQYVENGTFYTDSGAANAYVLTGIGTKQSPTAYTDGFEIRFLPANTNTTASTVNAATLGVKTIVNFNGNALIGGELVSGEPIRAFYDLGNDRFQILVEMGESNYKILQSGTKNFIINGEIDIWQRGTSLGTGYTADRWFNQSAFVTVTRVASTFDGSEFSLQTSAVGGVSPDIKQLVELTEIGNIGPFKANTEYTLSFTIADVAASDNIRLLVDLVDGAAGANSVSVVALTNIGTTINGTQRISFTFNFGNPAVSGGNQGLRIAISLDSINSVFILGLVQLEESATETEYEFRSTAEELSLCQRYYEKSYNIDIVPGAVTNTGRVFEWANRNSAADGLGFQFMSRKRIDPTVVLFSSNSGASGMVFNGVDRVASPFTLSSRGIDELQITGGTISSLSYHFTADAEL